MNKSNVLTAFNNHLMELFSDIKSIIKNSDLEVAHTGLLALKKANPRLLIGVWKEHIADKYRGNIEAGDIGFFLEKDYSNDLDGVEQPSVVLEKINILRKPVRELGEENLKKTISYMQNLTKLCDVYHTN